MSPLGIYSGSVCGSRKGAIARHLFNSRTADEPPMSPFGFTPIHRKAWRRRKAAGDRVRKIKVSYED